MKSKIKRIKVRCTRGIALEMCRYDSASIISETLIDSRHDAHIDTYAAHGWTPDEIEHEKEQRRIYDFIIEGKYCTTGRWHSFGVQPVEV